MTLARKVQGTALALALSTAACIDAAPDDFAPAAGAQLAGGGLAVRVGDVVEYGVETEHPYPAGSWIEEVSSPGAEFIRVHFTGFELAPGDRVTVSSPDGGQVYTYEGRGPNGDGEFWSFAIDGDTALVELQARGGGRAHGFRLESVGHGTSKLARPEPEVVCGDGDGRQNIACHTGDPAIDAAQRPVARLLFVMRGAQYVCTGWLVAGPNANTMLTNNHCFADQRGVNSVQAMFDYQAPSCGTPAVTGTNYAGGTFLKTNAVDRKGTKGGLDYTLFTVQGNPEATYGELTATTKQAVVGENIWFIQHGGGGPKEIGYWEDPSQTARCNVDTINQTYGKSAASSQTGYACDSEGGSSGSPIIDEVTGHVIGLHHFGNVTTGSCLNSATEMSAVCADAGSLLACVSN